MAHTKSKFMFHFGFRISDFDLRTPQFRHASKPALLAARPPAPYLATRRLATRLFPRRGVVPMETRNARIGLVLFKDFTSMLWELLSLFRVSHPGAPELNEKYI